MRIIHYNAGGAEFSGREFQYDAHHAHMIHELRQNGHEVLHINPAAELKRFGTAEEYQKVTLKAVKAFQDDGGCDMFFATAVDHSFLASTARRISALGIPTVNLNMDDLSHPYRVRAISKGFDLVLTTERANIHLLRKWGARKVVHMPFAANPHMFYPVNRDRERAFCFIGASYGARARAMAMLAQAGVPMRAYGTSPMDIYGEGKKSFPALRALMNYRDGWQRFTNSMSFASGRTCVRAALKRTYLSMTTDMPEDHPKDGDIEYHKGPPFDQFSHVMGGAALSLGSIELASTFVNKSPLMFIRFREFEAAMCGAAHVVHKYAELEEYFEPDKEMIFHQGFDELIDKGRYYLDPARDTIVQKIRENARARALAQHTWTHRFQSMFDTLGVKAKL